MKSRYWRYGRFCIVIFLGVEYRSRDAVDHESPSLRSSDTTKSFFVASEDSLERKPSEGLGDRANGVIFGVRIEIPSGIAGYASGKCNNSVR